ncbi:MAG: VIT and VWA domain-containing protein, partial [Myxococcota bacterium]
RVEWADNRPRTRISALTGSATLATVSQQRPLAAGETAMAQDGRVSFQPSASLAYQTAWARDVRVEAEYSSAEDAVPTGIGDIMGRNPANAQVLPEAIAITEMDIHATIRGRVARTEIEQVFKNTTQRTLEGIYSFPLPQDASIVRFAMLIGDTWMEGEIEEKGRAKQIFDSIVDDYMRPKDPALLEWKEDNTFQMRIFPIFPGTEQRIILWYTQVLPADGTESRYTYPMPRTGAVAIQDFRFSADIKLRDQPIKQARMPMYAGSVDLKEAQGSAVVRFEKEQFKPRQDIVVEWEVPQYAASQTYTGLDREGDDPYFMLVLRPSLPAGVAPVPKGRDHLFLVDTSLGTAPGDLKAASAAVAAWSAQLGPDDRLSVMAVDQEVRPWPRGFASVTQESVQEALAFLEQQTPGGASNLEGAFTQARQLLSGSRERPVVVYIGDGRASLGETRPEPLVDAVESALGTLRPTFHAVGVGNRVETPVLRVLARRFGGAMVRLNRGEDVPKRISEVALGARRASLRQATLAFSSDTIDWVYPTHLPTLYQGEEVVVVGRFRGEVDGQVTLTGLTGDTPFAQPFHVELSASHAPVRSFVPRIWAQRDIEHLTLYGGEGSREAIIATSRRHTIMSRYTSFIVLENERMYTRYKVERKRNRDHSDLDTQLDATADAPSPDRIRNDGVPKSKPTSIFKEEERSEKESSSADMLAKRAKDKSGAAATPLADLLDISTTEARNRRVTRATFEDNDNDDSAAPGTEGVREQDRLPPTTGGTQQRSVASKKSKSAGARKPSRGASRPSSMGSGYDGIGVDVYRPPKPVWSVQIRSVAPQPPKPDQRLAKLQKAIANDPLKRQPRRQLITHLIR